MANVTLCQIVVSYAENRVAFKKCHFELQNVCKAENIFKVLEI